MTFTSDAVITLRAVRDVVAAAFFADIADRGVARMAFMSGGRRRPKDWNRDGCLFNDSIAVVAAVFGPTATWCVILWAASGTDAHGTERTFVIDWHALTVDGTGQRYRGHILGNVPHVVPPRPDASLHAVAPVLARSWLALGKGDGVRWRSTAPR